MKTINKFFTINKIFEFEDKVNWSTYTGEEGAKEINPKSDIYKYLNTIEKHANLKMYDWIEDEENPLAQVIGIMYSVGIIDETGEEFVIKSIILKQVYTLKTYLIYPSDHSKEKIQEYT